MADKHFFDESTEQSKVKTAIVTKYFDAWAKVMIATQRKHGRSDRIAYVDLFAGPGRYLDGTPSTPLLILQKAIQNPEIGARLVTIFNDKDEANTRSLEQAISELPGIETLKYKPVVQTIEIGEQIAELFEQHQFVPTLFFVDPWGYRGLSLRLVNSVVKDWGCDCVFFFNYNRINAGLDNPMVKQHMDCLFGTQRADVLRQRLRPLRPHAREMLIVEELCQALKALGTRYVLPFRFRNDRGTRTSHHLIFVSKAFKGYEIMKDIMARESSSREQGVASFEYNAADAAQIGRQALLFQLSRPQDDLADMLLNDFAGQTLTMKEIYERHNVDRPYTKRNYKDALTALEKSGRVTVSSHRRNSFGDRVLVTFPPR